MGLSISETVDVTPHPPSWKFLHPLAARTQTFLVFFLTGHYFFFCAVFLLLVSEREEFAMVLFRSLFFCTPSLSHLSDFHIVSSPPSLHAFDFTFMWDSDIF